MNSILFLTNRVPNDENAGGILYYEMLNSYGLDKFRIISVSQTLSTSKYLEEFDPSKVSQFAIRIKGNNLFQKLLKKTPLIEPIYLFFKLRQVKREVVKLLKQESYDAVFACLRGDVLLLLESVLDQTNLPLVAMIEDTVEREIDDHKMIYRRKYKNYYSVLGKVKSLGVPSENLHGYLKKKYNLSSTILRPSYPSMNDREKYIDNKLNIFFSGNLYAKNEAKVFLTALEFLAESNPELEIVLFVASHIRLKSNSSKFKVINLGWIDQSELLSYADECHISYLPYKFEKEFLHSMKYAFPGKAGLYISNNLPIFFHGPKESSFNAFNKKYEVGVSCDSLDPVVIASDLNSLIHNKEQYKNYQKQCKLAFTSEFLDSIFDKRVKELFDNCN